MSTTTTPAPAENANGLASLYYYAIDAKKNTARALRDFRKNPTTTARMVACLAAEKNIHAALQATGPGVRWGREKATARDIIAVVFGTESRKDCKARIDAALA